MALLQPADVPLLLAGAAMLLLAAWVTWLDFGNRVNRAFALFLVVRAMVNGVQAFWSGDLAAVTQAAWPYFGLAMPGATLWFLHRYRERYAGASGWRWVGAVLLGVTGLLVALYAWDASLFWSGDPLVGVTAGPLFAIGVALIPAYGLAAAVLARDYARTPDGPRRRSLFVLSVAMALDALFFALAAPVELLLFEGRLYGDAVWGLLAYVVTASALAPIAFARFAVRRAGVGRDARVYDAWLGAVIASVVIASVGAFVREGLGGTLFTAFDGIWTFLMPVMAAYAIARHQLFDIDVKVRWTISRGTVAALFVLVFLVVTQVAQEYLNETYGLVFGGVATGMLLFAIAPIQRMAERVASAAMPGVRPVADLGRAERLALYREQLAAAWSDGALSHDEVRLLRVARDRLGLSLEETEHLEREVTGS